MSEPPRQLLTEAVMLRMRDIRTANGYSSNLGYNVHDWQTHFQDDELPALSVCDMEAAAEPAEGSDPRSTIWRMNTQFRIYAARTNTPKEIRRMIADVYRAIRQDDRWKDENGIGLAMTTRPQRDGFIIPEDSFEVVGAAVDVEILFFTKKFYGD